MELLRQEEPLKCKYKDVVFLVKRRASAYDKFLLSVSGRLEGNSVKYDPSVFYKSLVRQFVIGWEGVTDNGKDVEYSFELLETRFPSDPKDDPFLKLGEFIRTNTDVFKRDIELKNASRGQSNGSVEQEHSNAKDTIVPA